LGPVHDILSLLLHLLFVQIVKSLMCRLIFSFGHFVFDNLLGQFTNDWLQSYILAAVLLFIEFLCLHLYFLLELLLVFQELLMRPDLLLLSLLSLGFECFWLEGASLHLLLTLRFQHESYLLSLLVLELCYSQSEVFLAKLFL
jgi:hypothetical protein